jgi:serine/threonine protein kinase
MFKLLLNWKKASVNIGSPQDTVNVSTKSGRVIGQSSAGAIKSSSCVTARKIASQVASKPVSAPSQIPSFTTRLLGIWRLGQPIAAGPHSLLSAAQPADSAGNTRWDYAVRSIPPTADRGEAIAQMQRFAAAAATVRHPHLVAVLDSSLDGAEPFLVMPRLDNRSLADVLAAGAIQPLPVVLWLVRQAAEAASSLHQNGFVHGDIKPENVLLSPRGHATLIDLGFARRIGEPGDGVFRGSAGYTAPEMIDGKTPASPAADCFSLARLLWQMLSLTDRTATTSAGIDAVADLIAELVDADPKRRPTAESMASRLIRLEIETLGCHIRPGRTSAKSSGPRDKQRAA